MDGGSGWISVESSSERSQNEFPDLLTEMKVDSPGSNVRVWCYPSNNDLAAGRGPSRRVRPHSGEPWRPLLPEPSISRVCRRLDVMASRRVWWKSTSWRR